MKEADVFHLAQVYVTTFLLLAVNVSFRVAIELRYSE